MPSNLKQVATHTFIDGIDTVTAPELARNTTARYILNCHTSSTGVGNVGIVTNVKGTTAIQTALPSGENKCIGTCTDEEKGVFYYFIWNSNGFHGIYRYEEIPNSITLVLQDKSDFGDLSVLNFSKDNLILMANVIRNKLLYWVDGLNDARKINVDKALDQSESGYGNIVLEEYINANKLQPAFSATAEYYSDTTKPFNYLYGKLRKFAYRYKYDDGEWSNYSDFSNVATPPKESFTGVNTIPTDNNAINITVNTGSLIVDQIEIAMFEPTLELPNPDWDIIATLDKKKLDLGENTNYVYTFYNDGSYPKADPLKINRAYSYLPNAPLCQEVVQGCMVYSNFSEGFEDVELDVEIELSYQDLFLDSGSTPVLNNPVLNFSIIMESYRYLSPGVRYVNVNGQSQALLAFYGGGAARAVAFAVTIGKDVKAGNVFTVNFYNGSSNFTYSYIAKLTDTASMVANSLKQLIISSGVVILQAGNSATYNVYVNENDGFGNITFRFFTLSRYKDGYYWGTGSVNPVSTETLKDTGQSVSNQKLGAGTKYGIVYTDRQRKRSLVYTEDALNVTTATENALGGLKAVKASLTVNHLPPLWAYYWEVVRTDDLTFGNFIDLVIQKVIDVTATNSGGDYLDLVVGSLYTYQKIHPNTTLSYEFKKGDRIRLKQKRDGTYYPDLETEILSYKDVTLDLMESNLKVDGTENVVVASANDDNIGKFIQVDGNEREIIGVNGGTIYILNAPIGTSGSPETFLAYNLVDRRGLLRIRKPGASTGIVIDDNSLVEIFTPAKGGELGAKQFYHFNKKFNVLNAGLPTRAHGGNVQNQTASQGAIVDITEGTVYVRNREMPVTNTVPNAQVVIKVVEDPAYSDFYYSDVNDNGRTNVEDNKLGVVHFGDRMRYSAIQIENTALLGFNDFNNLDRRDYNDQYGDIKLTVYTEGQVLVFKAYKDCTVPVFQTVIQDNSGQELLGASKQLLNDIRYYSHDGGIGNNPESYCRNENRHYHLSPNSGCWVRLSTDGVTPISEIYFFDNEARILIDEGVKNGTYFFGGYDRLLNQVIWHIEGYVTKTLSTGFDIGSFEIYSPELPEGAVQSITVQPTNGTITVSDQGNPVYKPNADYVGSDSFQYTTIVDGETVTRKVCLTVNPVPVQETSWRPVLGAYTCVLNEDGEVTGYKQYNTLEEFYLATGANTGVTKPNEPSDPNYSFPVLDTEDCEPTFKSDEISGLVQRDNCATGSTGTSVTYTVPFGYITSTISKEDANEQAQEYFDETKQAYANNPANGAVCVPDENNITMIVENKSTSNVNVIRVTRPGGEIVFTPPIAPSETETIENDPLLSGGNSFGIILTSLTAGARTYTATTFKNGVFHYMSDFEESNIATFNLSSSPITLESGDVIKIVIDSYAGEGENYYASFTSSGGEDDPGQIYVQIADGNGDPVTFTELVNIEADVFFTEINPPTGETISYRPNIDIPIGQSGALLTTYSKEDMVFNYAVLVTVTPNPVDGHLIIQ